MRNPVPFTCDGCKAVKKETNHWWIVSVSTEVLSLMPWNEDVAAQEGIYHLCGGECVSKFLSARMEDVRTQLTARESVSERGSE